MVNGKTPGQDGCQAVDHCKPQFGANKQQNQVFLARHLQRFQLIVPLKLGFKPKHDLF